MTWPQDRAAVVTMSIGATITNVLNNRKRGGPATLETALTEIEAVLRDEFADERRQARSEYELPDD